MNKPTIKELLNSKVDLNYWHTEFHVDIHPFKSCFRTTVKFEFTGDSATELLGTLSKCTVYCNDRDGYHEFVYGGPNTTEDIYALYTELRKKAEAYDQYCEEYRKQHSNPEKENPENIQEEGEI